MTTSEVTDILVLWENSDLVFVIFSYIVFILTFDTSKIRYITDSFIVFSRYTYSLSFLETAKSDFLFAGLFLISFISIFVMFKVSQLGIVNVSHSIAFLLLTIVMSFNFGSVIHLLSLLDPKVKSLASFSLRLHDFLDLLLFRKKF